MMKLIQVDETKSNGKLLCVSIFTIIHSSYLERVNNTFMWYRNLLNYGFARQQVFPWVRKELENLLLYQNIKYIFNYKRKNHFARLGAFIHKKDAVLWVEDSLYIANRLTTVWGL